MTPSFSRAEVGRLIATDLKAQWTRQVGNIRAARTVPGRPQRRKRAGQTFATRSSWEANYVLYLNFRQARGDILWWRYESRVFTFPVKRGSREYRPDFEVMWSDGRGLQWHEVKGRMDTKSATRLKRMAKYYPRETVVVIDRAWFAGAERVGWPGFLPGWERL